MSTKNETNNKNERSFIENARRNQIVECAIDTISEIGYAKASLGQIAERANVSKGVISYHFASKEELLEQILIDYYHAFISNASPQFDSQLSPLDMLKKYIEDNLKFISENRKHVFAVIDINSNKRTDDGKLRFAEKHDETVFQPIENILYLGMEKGYFRDFTPSSARVMALTIRSAIDGYTIELMRNPEFDIENYTKEVLKIFELATQKTN